MEHVRGTLQHCSSMDVQACIVHREAASIAKFDVVHRSHHISFLIFLSVPFFLFFLFQRWCRFIRHAVRAQLKTSSSSDSISYNIETRTTTKVSTIFRIVSFVYHIIYWHTFHDNLQARLVYRERDRYQFCAKLGVN